MTEEQIDSQWEQNYNASITITNIGTELISNWNLSFSSDDTIENIWNGIIYEQSEGKYIIKNAGYNQNIAVGESVSFGYTACYDGESYTLPNEFQMLGTVKEAEEEKYSVVYNVASDWGSGYSSTITITNLSDVVIEDWALTICFDRDISTIWNAVIEYHEGNQYVLKNAGYNQNIGINETIVIGFNGNDTNTGAEPYDLVLTEASLKDTKYIELADGKIDAEYMERAIYPKLVLLNQPIDNVRLSDDFDRDGLTLIEEYDYDTNPFKADTDEDGLTDYEEVYQYGTNPIKSDTDEDEMTDGTEVTSGLDPLDVDSDGNGILDGEEIVKQQVRINDFEQYKLEQVLTQPFVEITGRGDYSKKLNAVKVEHDATVLDINCLVGTPFDFVHNEELSFESSTLSFVISEDILQQKALEDLAIVWYNEEDNALELLETSCNPADNTISAEVTHYSIYMVVDVPQYFFDIDWQNEGSIIQSGKADVVFVVDTTGSMQEELQNVKNNIEQFVSELEEKNVDIRLGLVEYKDIYADGTGSTKNYDWYTSVSDFKDKLGSLSTYGGGGDGPETIVDALDCARKMSYRIGVKKYIIALTDANYHNGTSTDRSVSLSDETKKLAEEGIVTSVITDSRFYNIYNELTTKTDGVTANIYANFADTLSPLIDKMGEQVNSGCWIRLANGSIVCLDADPTLGDLTVDTDEDAIPDILELKHQIELQVRNPYTGEKQEIAVWSFASNPVKMDTDNDGLEDALDLRPKTFDTVIVEENDIHILFNTGRTWNKLGCSTYDYLDNLTQFVDNHIDNPIAMEDFATIIEDVSNNCNQKFNIEELIAIGLIDNEGAKLYMENVSEEVREIVFYHVMKRECKYYQYGSSGWGHATKETESGFFQGTVISEADINFSCKGYFLPMDIYMVIDALELLGAVIISTILIVEVTPVILTNLNALIYYTKNFGIMEGIKMYQYLGVQNVPNGVISWIQMDMADGDSSLDDAAGTVQGSNKIVQTIKNKFPNDNQIGQKYNYSLQEGKLYIENGVQNVDFIIDLDGNLYIGKGHSFLAGTNSVQAAGTMKVNSQGYIRLITNESGHFQPTVEQALNYPTIFKNIGLNVDNAWIRIGQFETSLSNYVISSQIYYNGPIQYIPE